MLEESLQLKVKLESQIKFLKNHLKENKEISIPVSIEGMEMHFDPEILIKEKETELENVNMYYEEYLSVSKNIISVSQKISILRKEKKDEALFYYNGVPFEFKTKEILIKLEQELILLKKQHSELYNYLNTGEHIY